jgi:hypothetical protein
VARVRRERGAPTDSAEPETESKWVDWREADLQAQPGRAKVRLVRVLAWATAVTGFVVLLMDVQRDPNRCHPDCFDGSDSTFEPGHVWTAYVSSWQWDAQLMLGWGACAFAFWALYAAGRRARWQTWASLGLALGCIVAWIVWITVQPPPTQLL